MTHGIETPTGINLYLQRLMAIIILSAVTLMLAIPTAFVFGFLIKCSVKLFTYGFNLWT